MSQTPSEWWTFHGDTDRSGFVSNSAINAGNVSQLKTLHTLQLGGPVLSTPAVVGGFIYVGTANGSRDGTTTVANGGAIYKIDLQKGTIVATFNWLTDRSEGDTHGFTGMGSTPAVVGDKVYFSAFNGRLYCLNVQTLALVWVTDLRIADPAQNQPVSNIGKNPAMPQAEGWCSPLVVNGRVYVGMGEGENPDLYGFVYCLDAATGKVIWVFCTSQFEAGQDNVPNQIPLDAVDTPLPPGFTLYEHPDRVVARGCVVWSALTYDTTLNRIYCATGNPQPDSNLPAPGYAYSVLALDADKGNVLGQVQVPPGSSYRPSDIDIDFGTSPILFTSGGNRVLGIGCKNGAFLLIDAITMKLIRWRQLLPYFNDNTQIPTVDPHDPNDPSDTSINPNPRISNEDSNKKNAENFHGTYSTAAVHPGLGRLFVGVGGNNYHFVAAGIDYETTPFLRVMDWNTLDDAWELDNGNPRKYVKPVPPMYTTPGEGGLSSPAVVNDVVFCSTTKVSLYAFDAKDGTPLWHDDLGMQTGGYNGGFGYCLGPAIAGNYVVAGALINGRDGGILRIYGFGQ